MPKFIAILSVCMLGSAFLLADCCVDEEEIPVCACYLEEWPSPVNIEAGVGYRIDKFRWSIAGPDNFPNVMSELQWKNLRIAQADAVASYVSCRNYAVRVAGDFGWIYSGNNTDADFSLNDEEGLISLSKNDASGGYVYDINGGVGYRVTSTFARFTATPLIGYSYHGQNLRMHDGKQIFVFDTGEDSEVEIVVPFSGLHSTYNTRWFGPWIGMDFEARVESCAYVFGGFEWHLFSYRGVGDWNLREELTKFYHRAHGQGYVVNLGGKWEIWDNWSIGVKGSFRYFRTHDGQERNRIELPGLPEIIVEQPFNGARWKAVTMSVIVAVRF